MVNGKCFNRLLDTDNWILITDYRLPDTDYQILITDY
jgi:hypothetical protein